MDNKKIGQFIAECRKQKGITQKELADVLGVTNRAISKWETGTGLPDISILPELAAVLGTTVDELLNGEKKRQKKRKKVEITKKMILSAVCFLFATLGLAMQIVYLTLGREYRMEYIIDSLFYMTNGIVILFMFGGIFLLAGRKSKISKGCAIICAVLFLLNMIFGFMNIDEQKEAVIEYSPNYKKMLILKYDESSGKMCYYRNQILWFARPHTIFPYTVEGDIKTQWLAEDVCAVTYQSPDDGKVHQFVATYGDRGDGMTTPYVYNLITGEWIAKENNTASWKIETGMEGITVSDGGSVYEKYAYDEGVQFGTLALVLCKNGLPIWTISLNEDCEIGENGYLKSGGTISLCRVSMEKTTPILFGRASSVPDYSVNTEVIKTDEEQGKALVREMKQILRKNPDLSEYQSHTEGLKVEAESDFYWMMRNAVKERKELLAINGVDSDVQIHSIEILAGGDYDCLVEMQSTETAGTGADSETVDFITQYRVMKGEGVYLICRVSYGVDGLYGLEETGIREKKVFSDNEEYHFFTPGIKLEGY